MKQIGALLAAGVLVTTVACSSPAPENGGAGEGENGSASNSEPIKIGALIPESGPYAALGAEHAQAYDFAAAEINRNGGLLGRQVEVIHGDTLGTPEGAVAAAERLIQREGADLLIGTIASNIASAVSQRLEGWDALMVGTNAQADTLTGADCNTRFFRANMSDQMSFNAVRAWLEANPKDSWDHLGADYAWGRNAGAILQQVAADSGSTVNVDIYSPLGTTDFGSYISQLNGGGGLMTSLGGGDAINFYSQANDFGLLENYDSVFGNASFLSQALEALGDNAPFGAVGSGLWTSTFDTPGSKAFVEAFEAEHGKIPGDVTGFGYLGMQTLFAGIEAAGSAEPGDVAAALEGLTFDSIKGEVTMRAEDHQLAQPLYLGEVTRLDSGDIRLAVTDVVPLAEASGQPDPACQL